jgi:hypothetical protein
LIRHSLETTLRGFNGSFSLAPEDIDCAFSAPALALAQSEMDTGSGEMIATLGILSCEFLISSCKNNYDGVVAQPWHPHGQL